MRNADGLTVYSILRVNRNYYVHVLDSNVIRTLDKEEIIVGIYSIIGNVGDNAVGKYVAFAPSGFFCKSRPIAGCIRTLVVGRKRGVGVVVDLFCNCGYVFRNVEY